MECALNSGAAPVRLADVVERLQAPVTGRHFCVTFDDGYRDNVETGEAILSELGIPGTIYLVTEVMDRRRPHPWSPAAQALTWDEAEAAQRRGVFDFRRTRARTRGSRRSTTTQPGTRSTARGATFRSGWDARDQLRLPRRDVRPARCARRRARRLRRGGDHRPRRQPGRRRAAAPVEADPNLWRRRRPLLRREARRTARSRVRALEAPPPTRGGPRAAARAQPVVRRARIA